jgi:hypothetical protein
MCGPTPWRENGRRDNRTVKICTGSGPLRLTPFSIHPAGPANLSLSIRGVWPHVSLTLKQQVGFRAYVRIDMPTIQ